MKRIFLFPLLFATCLLLLSCGAPNTEYRDINHLEWFKQDTLMFVVPSDRIVNQSATLYIRHNNDYSFQNIWLKVSCVDQDSVPEFSRIEFQLAEPNGRWIGKKSGAMYNLSTKLSGLDCPSDTCTIQIIQNMRVDPLPGIQSVGLGFDEGL